MELYIKLTIKRVCDCEESDFRQEEHVLIRLNEMSDTMGDAVFEEAKFLIVDDQLQNIDLLERILTRDGYQNIKSTTDSTKFLDLYHEYQPDIILLDLHMPNLNGFDLLHVLQESIESNEYLPVLVLTADTTTGAKRKALSAGAKDFITKPLDRMEVLLRIHNFLETRKLYKNIQDNNSNLEYQVEEKTRELKEAQFEILESMAKAAEFRDDNTGEHTVRVGNLSAGLAHCLGMDASECELIRLAAPLNDIGKIGISDLILLKPGRLTKEEFKEMKSHTWLGHEILIKSHYSVFKLAAEISISHHESWDGSGYPYGLMGNDIPFVGQVVSIIDVFDALTHIRPYKRAWSSDEAMAEIMSLRGVKFNPEIVDAFMDYHQGSLEKFSL